MHIQSRNSGMGEWDFSTLLKDLASGISQVELAKAQADILKSQAEIQKAQQQQAILARYNPQYSGTYSNVPTSGQSDMMPWFLLGGAALLVFFVLKG